MAARLLLLALAAAALAAPCASADRPAPPARPGAGVQRLDGGSFDAAVRRGPLLLYVGAPFCVHCQRLAPVFASLAALPPFDGGAVALGTVDGPSEPALAGRLGATAYPHLLFISGWRVWVYPPGAPRSARALASWAAAAKGGRLLSPPPLPWHRSPTGAAGRLRAAAVGAPGRAARAGAAAWRGAGAATGLLPASPAALAALFLLAAGCGLAAAVAAVEWAAQAGGAAAAGRLHQA